MPMKARIDASKWAISIRSSCTLMATKSAVSSMRPASKQHDASAVWPSLVEARDRKSPTSAKSAVASPPSMRCSRDF
jgi:hypothetical protein